MMQTEKHRPVDTRDVFRAARWVRIASQGLFLLAALLLLVHVVLYVYYAIGLMRFPFDYDQGEGFELVDTIMFSKGQWPYQDVETYPFYSSNYPPLFHVILVPFVWVFGEAYWYGRLVGFLGTLVTASTIAYIVQREGHDRRIAIFSGAAFLASNYVYHVGPLFRQHMTMVMFETLSVAILAHAGAIPDRGRRRRMIALGLALLLAAGYTKQLALASAVAVFVFLFIRSPRRSLPWGVLFAAVGIALFVWIDLATHGAWWTNSIAANVNDYYPRQLAELFKQWLRLHGVLVVLAAVVVVYELYFTRLSIYSIWWVFAVANTTLSGKWGAGDSYFATAIAATCILSGIFAARTLHGAWAFPDNYVARGLRLRSSFATHRQSIMRAAAVFIPLVYLVYGVSVIKLPTEGAVFGPLADALGLESTYGTRYAFYDSAGSVPGYAALGHVPTRADIDRGWQIVDIVREGLRPAMSEEAAFSLHADKDVVTNPTQLKNLYENDLFDPTSLIAALQGQEFNVLVFRAQFYPPPVLDAAYQAYYPSESIVMNGFAYEIWRPGPAREVRAQVARWFETRVPDSPPSTMLALDVDQAVLWLHHMAAYYDWEIEAESLQSGTGCVERRYASAGIDGYALVATVCPAEEGSQVTLAGL